MEFLYGKVHCLVGNSLSLIAFLRFGTAECSRFTLYFFLCTWHQPFLQGSLDLSRSVHSLIIIFSCIYHCKEVLRRYFFKVIFRCILTASLVTQMVKNLPAMQETQVWSLGWEDPLEKGIATHASILAWRIPLTDDFGGWQSMDSQRIRHHWVTNTFTFIRNSQLILHSMLKSWKLFLLDQKQD